MKPLLLGYLVVASCALSSCAASSEDSLQTADALTGVWVGDFGPAFFDRNTISLELHWDGKELTGMIRPGVQGTDNVRVEGPLGSHSGRRRH